MKVFCLLALFTLAVSAFPVEEERDHGENGWYLPQLNGSVVWMYVDEGVSKLSELEIEENRRRLTLNPVSFYLYTKANPSNAQRIFTTTKSINNSNFNAKNPARFVIHGFTNSYTSPMNKGIREAWLSRGAYNIIIVDWPRARLIDYISAVVAIPNVGKKIAAMIDFLVKDYKMSLDTLNVIGHSLGAHVAGHTGKNVKSGQIQTIVGLDPALPLFFYNRPSKRLASTDGQYVESIHTSGGKLGFLKPIGEAAFYPNGGKSQPGCGIDLFGSCAHRRSPIYYAEAVRKNNFPSIKCSNYIQAVKKSCNSTYSSVRMGADSNAYIASGNFYVPIYSKAPYGIGA